MKVYQRLKKFFFQNKYALVLKFYNQFLNNKTIFSSRLINILELGSFPEIVLYSLVYLRTYLMFIPDSFLWTFLSFSELKCLGATSTLSFVQPIFIKFLHCARHYLSARVNFNKCLICPSSEHLAYSSCNITYLNIDYLSNQFIDSLRTGTMSSIISNVLPSVCKNVCSWFYVVGRENSLFKVPWCGAFLEPLR